MNKMPKKENNNAEKHKFKFTHLPVEIQKEIISYLSVCVFHSIRSSIPRLIDQSLRFNSIKHSSPNRSVIPVVTDQISERSDVIAI